MRSACLSAVQGCAIGDCDWGEEVKGPCEVCRFWERGNGTSLPNVVGACRRFPPMRGKWAVTHQEDWCGEFSQRATPNNPLPTFDTVRSA